MKIRTTFAVLAIAAMGSIGTIAVVNTASSQNTTAGAADTSNMMTF